MDMHTLYLTVPLAPLAGAIVAGLFGKQIGRIGAHTVTILGVLVAFLASLLIFQDVQAGHTYNGAVYTWLTSGKVSLEVGFLIDRLTTVMMLVVTFVSLCVHVYTIGYMADDDGYQRFFSYISLFTFSMLMLVMSNNFLQLFFGWEAVGLVSYLLIGFWYTRESAIYANLKAFLVNRVGDFGFLLGIGLVLAYFGSLDYAQVFQTAPMLADHSISLIEGHPWSLLTVICILLFIGAMGKSAQFPLHVWLPDSMEGPTPISALIHAATMVTAGIFMVARMSPLFELSDTALSFVMVIGAITALFMGFLGMIQNDIKRVIAYSTLSQLGYMTVALGASAYSVAIFHLMTHAFFKALLFLAAGSVIIGMHHDQDIRNMGGLRKYMPITWLTLLIGSLALIGTPGLSGFYSKDSIIEAVHASHLWGSGFAAFAVTAGVFVTAFYSFRMYFMVFHGKERFHNAHTGHDQEGGKDDDHGGHGHHTPHESPWVVWLPLVLLAIPSVYTGWAYIEPMLYGDFFGSAIYINAEAHPAMEELRAEFHGAGAMALHAFATAPFWLALAGVAAAYYLYMVRRDLPQKIRAKAGVLYAILEDKYGFDRFNDWFFAGGARLIGGKLWRWGDVTAIDGLLVNGSARLVGRIAAVARHLQSGYIYHYAFAMIIGVALLATWFVQL
ncbi:NADH-quinone oxidoreductase subunit L [Parasulfuritortus cantonensis]|uniref:NADH-quinone oxidoreductase subunit L n=1 Tax=Parasulfuritortus cantonensis TaxID=2528202 RepID=A0A4R1BF84_9PROT|nr:NADH-quinone oxidoreductase subunit L [Parasulfuritortus cantonensis]TCJ15809.1 NADH-quinone oxidoreductase subunit L [Parasulfuritortus cantonensis]